MADMQEVTGSAYFEDKEALQNPTMEDLARLSYPMRMAMRNGSAKPLQQTLQEELWNVPANYQPSRCCFMMGGWPRNPGLLTGKPSYNNWRIYIYIYRSIHIHIYIHRRLESTDSNLTPIVHI